MEWIYMAHDTNQWRALVTMLFTTRLHQTGLVVRMLIFPKGTCFLERMPGESNRQQ